MGLTLYGLPLYADPFDSSQEVWADLVGFNGFYIVSTYGRIVSNHKRAESTLRPWWEKQGYWSIQLSSPLKGRRRYGMARLVLTTFVPMPDHMARPMVQYLDGDRQNMRLSNLAWQDVHMSKIDRAIASDIREWFRRGSSVRSIKEHYGLSGSHVMRILREEVWPTPLKTRV